MAFDVDFFVIGAGSGGVRAARIAAGHGAKTLVAEESRIGGTCVIRGCVPKKLYVIASRFADDFRDAAGFGWSVGEPRFDWPTLVAAKEKEITRLSDAYRDNLARSRRQARRTAGDRGRSAPGAARRRNRGLRPPHPHRLRLAPGHASRRRGARARDHLERDLRSQGLPAPASRGGRRLYRGRVRFALPAPGRRGHPGHARAQRPARLRRRHAQRHARRDGEGRRRLPVRLAACEN